MIQATRFGRPLPEGGTIGVAAAASPYDMRSELDRGVEWWESRGYRVKLAPGVHERDDYVAGDARRRADDLNALFADPEVDVVQALQGWPELGLPSRSSGFCVGDRARSPSACTQLDAGAFFGW